MKRLLKALTGEPHLWEPAPFAAQIREVVEVVGLQAFVKSQPLGLDTMIYPEGKRLSSTDNKKILSGACILKQPQLLLLEDL